MHLRAAVANGWRVEFHLDMWKIGKALYKDPPRPHRGMVTHSRKSRVSVSSRVETLCRNSRRNKQGRIVLAGRELYI